MAAPETTKIQVTWDGRNAIPMVNVYAQNADEAEVLHEWVRDNIASLIETGKTAHGVSAAVVGLPATVAAVPAAPAAPAAAAAAPAGHLCDCGQPMQLRSSSFGQFYSCSKRMDDTSRCKKKINVG